MVHFLLDGASTLGNCSGVAELFRDDEPGDWVMAVLDLHQFLGCE